MDSLKKLIREIPDFPKPGILFYDITTLLGDKDGFHELVDKLCEHYNGRQVDKVAGIEARGFIFGPALAYRLKAGFIPIRKPNKLPWKRAEVVYELEYGTDKLEEMHQDAVKPGERILICDDLLATGRAAAAANESWCGNSAEEIRPWLRGEADFSPVGRGKPAFAWTSAR